MIKEQDYEFLTSDDSVRSDPTYKIISEVLSRMIRSGSVNMGAGYCISMSDMVQTALRHRGIDSRLVECKATITYYSENPPAIRFIGFSDVVNPGEIDTHVVVVTNTEPAFVIDASIPHRLPQNTFALVEPVKSKNFDGFLIDSKFPKHLISMSYKEKEKSSVPVTHQQSILERMDTDRKIFKNLGLLKILIAVALIISTANALRGAYDFYMVYVDENHWGPRSLEKIDQRLDHLEELVTVPLEQRKNFKEQEKK
jgi:hypothetical protein